MDKDLLASAKSGPRRSGRKEIIKYLEGGKLTRSQAIRAKCFDCLGMGDQSICDSVSCSLNPFSPFRQKSQTTDINAQESSQPAVL